MVTATRKKVYTPDDLLEMGEEGEQYELLDGELVEVCVSARSEDIADDLRHRMRDFLTATPIGHVVPPVVGLQIFGRRNRVPRPDGGFIANGKLPGETMPDRGHFQFVPDLLMEVASPGDKVEPLRLKVQEYLAAGVQIVWVIFPATRDAEVWRQDGTMDRVPPDGSLDGEDIMPGFRCELASLMPAASRSAHLP